MNHLITRGGTTLTFRPITEDRYNEALECLPPIALVCDSRALSHRAYHKPRNSMFYKSRQSAEDECGKYNCLLDIPRYKVIEVPGGFKIVLIAA